MTFTKKFCCTCSDFLDTQILVDTPQCSNRMKSQTWKFFRLLRKIQINQQTKALNLLSYYQFNQVVAIKSEEITNISSKFNKNTV